MVRVVLFLMADGRRTLPTALPARINRHECKLELKRYSEKGVVADYQIILPPNEQTVDSVIRKTEDLFEAICAFYIDFRWKARLVALCEYQRLTNDGEACGRKTYHHASYQSEWCSLWTAEEFYRRHMDKIGNRVETFLRNGSSLRFSAFKHIHIAVTVVVAVAAASAGDIDASGLG